ncbi:FAD-linked oxidoreductase [Aspergillus sclerotiicarbonarius CBS 121057]|uniref:Proline dehydrogenase n=1 Tax=Aspergillus sclerotiicarbonarius (strain CBS 121057 / IBT 28362) TaxID=1448318 RepID=A0A319E0W1_ASPSB|nr:FAD-linked oxidoreductase [Aspergillus sclerotiicarbonarius CBS 121057]
MSSPYPSLFPFDQNSFGRQSIIMSSICARRVLHATRPRLVRAHPRGNARFSSTSTQFKSSAPQASWLQDRRTFYGAGGMTLAIAALLWKGQDTYDHLDDPRDRKSLSKVPLNKLISGWIAFTFCSSPTWVDMSETLYNILSQIPIISSITNAIVMRTFFNQFLGGESTSECIPKIEALRKDHIGTLLGYNIEAELDGSSKDMQLILRQTEHVLSSIEAQGDLARQFWPDPSATGGDNRCWVRIKVTGLLPNPIALYHGSNAILEARKEKGLDRDVPYPGFPHDGDWEAALEGKGVTDADRQELMNLRAILEKIASKARENNVRIVIDAEQSWYQPVIDSLTDELMQKYNSLDGPTTCIASFQAYLRRYPQLLDQQIKRADEKGYKLLFKQVRGAYMVTEAARWKKGKREGPGPVWATKEETDASYNYGIQKTLSTVADQVRQDGHSRISVFFATHNSISIDLAIKFLERHGLARRTADTTGSRYQEKWQGVLPLRSYMVSMPTLRKDMTT